MRSISPRVPRILRREPTFSLAAVFIITLGIAATSAVASIARGTILKPLPYDDPHRLGRLVLHKDGLSNDFISGYLIREELEPLPHLEGVAGIWRNEWLATGPLDPVRLRGGEVTVNYFGVLGVRASNGRLFRASDSRGPRVAVVSSRFATRIGLSDPTRYPSIQLNHVPYQIIGVVDRSFQSPEDMKNFATDIWVPVRSDDPVWQHPETVQQTAKWGLETILRLSGDQSFSDVEGHIDSRLGASSLPDLRGSNSRIIPLSDELTSRGRRPIFLMSLAVGLLLSISALNAGSLFLTRSLSRARETSIRLAIGGSRFRVMAETLVETIVICGSGAVLGILATFPLLSLFKSHSPLRLPRTEEIQPDVVVVMASVGIALLVSLFCTAMAAANPGHRRLASVLGDRGASTSHAPSRGRSLLMVFQLGLTFALVSAGLLTARTMLNIHGIEVGIEPDGRVAFDLPLDEDIDSRSRALLAGNILSMLNESPLTRRASFGSTAPVGRTFYVTRLGPDSTRVFVHAIGPDYLETLGIEPLRTEVHGMGYVNEAAARLLPVPLGSRLTLSGSTASCSLQPCEDISALIGGVIEPVRFRSLFEEVEPQILVPAEDNLWSPSATFVAQLRSGVTLAEFQELVRTTVLATAPNTAIPVAHRLERRITSGYAGRRFYAGMYLLLAATTVVLSAAGLYSITAWAARTRKKEMAIRAAIGARPAQIATLVANGSIRVTGGGIGFGLLVSLWSGKLLENVVFGLDPQDPLNFVLTGSLILATAMMASLLPAATASRRSPANVLRND